FNDVDLNRSGSFHVSLPSGAFYCNCKRSLYTLFGVANSNEVRLLPGMFGLTIEGVFPTPPQAGTALITYDYRSHAFLQFGGVPAETGSAQGKYKFGNHSLSRIAIDPQGNIGRDGGFTVIQSGVFLVTQAKLKLLGNNVFADM